MTPPKGPAVPLTPPALLAVPLTPPKSQQAPTTPPKQPSVKHLPYSVLEGTRLGLMDPASASRFMDEAEAPSNAGTSGPADSTASADYLDKPADEHYGDYAVPTLSCGGPSALLPGTWNACAVPDAASGGTPFAYDAGPGPSGPSDNGALRAIPTRSWVARFSASMDRQSHRARWCQRLWCQRRWCPSRPPL